MRKQAVQLIGVGLLLGMGLGVAPAIAQDSGRANTATDFNSPDANDGILGSDVSIFDLMRRASSAASGGGIADGGFYRSQNRRINQEADAFRERQRAILEQQAAQDDSPVETDSAPVE